MNIRYTTTILCLILSIACKLSAQEYAAASIPDSLKENADAVIRLCSQQFIQTGIDAGTYKVTEVTTILSKKGEAHANFYITDDKFRSLGSFSGTVRDASGQIVRKIKKGDLTKSSISFGSLATGDVSIFYECKYPTYPFTVEYVYEQKWKNGLLSYPAFNPLPTFNVALEYAEYNIELPTNTELRYKSNCGFAPVKGVDSSINSYFLSASNIKAIKSEPMTPSRREILPLALLAPAEFCYDDHCGNMSNWKNYGLWINDLLKGRDQIPQELAVKLQDMTKDAAADKEKVKRIYEFLQSSTRYVSIQLGIGGYQPFDAATVYKTGFGDCKALTNYMKAMLQSVGIASNYTVIGMNVRNVYPDYPNFNQFNHVVLLVPLKNDSIWLECTSPIEPFGYVHSSIAGNNALIVSDEGGKLCRLPSYPSAENKTKTELNLNLNEEGGIEGKAILSEYMANSEKTNNQFRANDREKYIQYINVNLKLPHARFGEIKTTNNTTEHPSTILEVDFHTDELVNKTGSRIFIPVCPLNKNNFDLFKASVRNLPIDIEDGYSESDSITFVLPQSYVVENLPKDVDVKTPFGSMVTSTKQSGNKITYTQEIILPSGRYESTQYKEIKAFFGEIMAATKRKLVLKKQP